MNVVNLILNNTCIQIITIRKQTRMKLKSYMENIFVFIYLGILYKIMGSREEDEIAGYFVFSNIRMRGYYRLGKG